MLILYQTVSAVCRQLFGILHIYSNLSYSIILTCCPALNCELYFLCDWQNQLMTFSECIVLNSRILFCDFCKIKRT